MTPTVDIFWELKILDKFTDLLQHSSSLTASPEHKKCAAVLWGLYEDIGRVGGGNDWCQNLEGKNKLFILKQAGRVQRERERFVAKTELSCSEDCDNNPDGYFVYER